MFDQRYRRYGVLLSGYTACSFQDITGQRTEKVVNVLRFIEQRINAMIEIWGVEDTDFSIDDLNDWRERGAARRSAMRRHRPDAR